MSLIPEKSTKIPIIYLRQLFRYIKELENTIYYRSLILLKEKAHSGVEPSVQEKKHYNTLLAKLQTLVLSTKYKLKTDVKELETNHYCSQGTLPNSNDDSVYDHLRKKLNYTQKLLTL